MAPLSIFSSPSITLSNSSKQNSGLFNPLPSELIAIIFQFLLEGNETGPVSFNRILRINKEFYEMCNWKITHCFSSLFNTIRFNWTHLERAAQRPEANQDLIEKLLKNKNCSDQLNFDFLKIKIINTNDQNEKAITTLLKTNTCQEIIKNGFSKFFNDGENFLITLIKKKNQKMVQVLWEPIKKCSTQVLDVNLVFSKSLKNDCYELSDWILENNRNFLRDAASTLWDNSTLFDILVKPGNHSLISKFPLITTYSPYSADPYSILSLAIQTKQPEVVKELLKNRTVVIDCLAVELDNKARSCIAAAIVLIGLDALSLSIELLLASHSRRLILLFGKILFQISFICIAGVFLFTFTVAVACHVFQLAKAVFFLASHYFTHSQKQIQSIKT